MLVDQRRFLMALRNAMSPAHVMEQARRIFFSGVRNFLELGHTVCIRTPKRVVIVCFTIQKELLFLPFRLLNKMYEVLLKRPSIQIYEVILKRPMLLVHSFYNKVTREDPSPVEILTGEKNPSSSTIIEAARAVRYSAVRKIKNENTSRTQISTYRRQLELWRRENERKTEEVYKISSEEKELMKAVAFALRHLRSLKIKRENLDTSLSESILNMINNGGISAEKLLAMQKKLKTADAAVNEKRNKCLNLLSQGNVVDMGLLDFLPVNSSSPDSHTKTDTQQLDSPAAETMKRVLSLIADENVFLKNRLANTHDKLEEILKLSENINTEISALSEKFAKMTFMNGEMASLQRKLDQERVLLIEVEADRDQMRDKLRALESLIKEEEDFLGDSAFESGYEDADFSSLTFSEQDDIST